MAKPIDLLGIFNKMSGMVLKHMRLESWNWVTAFVQELRQKYQQWV